MRALMEAGFWDKEELRILNRFRCHQQVLYLSDVLKANGKTIDKKYRNRRQNNKTWSTMIFPNENPPNRHLRLWQSALEALVPRGRLDHRLGAFEYTSHTVKEWTYDQEAQELYQWKEGTMNIYKPTRHPRFKNRANCWPIAHRDAEARDQGVFCSVNEIGQGIVSIRSFTRHHVVTQVPQDLWEVVEKWGHEWMWKELHTTGDGAWISEAIKNRSCIAITDGSYMKELHPTLNSAAFVIECQQGGGRLMGSFAENTPDACSYRGELLGLMAIHLVCLAVNELHPDLLGSIQIYLDCKGALHKIKNLPPYQIPSRCSHSDI
jgi:hypothetical protein